ncbi:DUF488 domain-containing protein [Gluconacetobacter entanii]|uniref:DUF488 domain-containing protein n=1 Tax=Gluconacetobacter entanii TaxID=108528 RepID=A0ABT3K3W9_9PROT|nr:DUF488 domain-containing protein [Gluconacetobacter entanii]MCW4590118.1 DUF488 domain-containing protein [Gluconacetobacter entanii]MCW4594733.1 DUF488 domain-containing protein [Gluconacetobacter entanii]NPC89298.1 DUF488 domain-containing protein [Gluconacetobacter entanii]
MINSQHILSTIGYESADLADFLETLRARGVTCIIDIRELPISRRRGFSKRSLSEALEMAGIHYIHLRGLGDPKEGRMAARAGDIKKFQAVFSRHLLSERAQADLKTAVDMVSQFAACLLCYERDYKTCHRTIVAKALSDIVPIKIRHLGVRAGLAEKSKQSNLFAPTE